MFLAPEHAQAVWDAVAGAGAVPYGVDIIEAVRVETGMVVTGYDYQEHERTPFDLGMDRLVALDAPGEFMGKDKLREVAATPPNRYKTLRLEGGALPEYGAAVTSGRRGRGRADESGREPEARARSASRSCEPTRRRTARGSRSRSGDGTVGATVDQLALYDPQKRRPRG